MASNLGPKIPKPSCDQQIDWQATGSGSGGEARDNADEATDPLDDITLVTNPSERLLNERQIIDHCTEREQCLDWLPTFGKDPEHAEWSGTIQSDDAVLPRSGFEGVCVGT